MTEGGGWANGWSVQQMELLKRANLQKVIPKEELTEIILAAGESDAKMTN